MASTYLARTFSGTPTMNTFTISFWIKRANINATQRIISARVDGNNESTLYFSSSNQFNIATTVGGATKCDIKANRYFRDTSAWYHIVVQKNTTLATANDRVKIWVNGVEETALTRSTTQVQNEEDFFLKSTATNEIGRRPSNNDQYFDGSLTHFCVVQGSVVAPTSFGEVDSTSGIWKFKSPSGVSFGTNGFHLKFENSGAMGTDSSGNSQTWTAGGTLTQSLDTPSNVYPSWNKLDPIVHMYNGGSENANTTIQTTTSEYPAYKATMGINKGKWYWEIKLSAKSSGSYAEALVGISSTQITGTTQELGDRPNDWGYYAGGGGAGDIRNNNSSSSYGTAWNVGTIICVAVDLDNNKLYFRRDANAWENSGDPTSGSTGTGAVSITDPDSTPLGWYFPAVSSWSSSQNVTFQANFGNGFFGSTAITSAGSNGNGSLFEYDVPSGYYALNTKNLNTYG